MDFVTLAMDALVNQAAKARFMFGGRSSVRMALRTPHGGGLSAGPQHSQCLEAWLAHVPGLKVLCPVESQRRLCAAARCDRLLLLRLSTRGCTRARARSTPRVAWPSVTPTWRGRGATSPSSPTGATEPRPCRRHPGRGRGRGRGHRPAFPAAVGRGDRVRLGGPHAPRRRRARGRAGLAPRSSRASPPTRSTTRPVLRVGAPFMPVPFARALEQGSLGHGRRRRRSRAPRDGVIPGRVALHRAGLPPNPSNRHRPRGRRCPMP